MTLAMEGGRQKADADLLTQENSNTDSHTQTYCPIAESTMAAKNAVSFH